MRLMACVQFLAKARCLKALIQRKMRKKITLTYFAVLTFFVGTADEKAMLKILTFFVVVPRSFDENVKIIFFTCFVFSRVCYDLSQLHIITICL